jgi:hypothetical protein
LNPGPVGDPDPGEPGPGAVPVPAQGGAGGGQGHSSHRPVGGGEEPWSPPTTMPEPHQPTPPAQVPGTLAYPRRGAATVELQLVLLKYTGEPSCTVYGADTSDDHF